jgi:hypothetical protein
MGKHGKQPRCGAGQGIETNGGDARLQIRLPPTVVERHLARTLHFAASRGTGRMARVLHSVELCSWIVISHPGDVDHLRTLASRGGPEWSLRLGSPPRLVWFKWSFTVSHIHGPVPPVGEKQILTAVDRCTSYCSVRSF